ncbi:hypothetical protein KU6B_46090 [Mameliella alba]|uniref:prepilin-type N-terminal cleavage/methylation domain-containing protein n=1 Tax=Mameliella alba TaxID=561184 RepID=UPI0013E44007|nr:prepilin-type N-terminal cleavage/methylation domain-containing protein [Mameliella alba]BBU58344.1 hypothetical protein KU6B_46090 [Mameliella alba]
MDGGLRSGDAGFSLLELMVSVAVLAVLAVGVGLSTGAAVPGAERDAQRFQRTFDQSWALAILARQEQGLEITPRGLTLSRHTTDGWDETRRLFDWRGQARLVSSTPMPAGTPRIRLRADGGTSAFALTFSGGGEVWRCASDGWSRLTCAPE